MATEVNFLATVAVSPESCHTIFGASATLPQANAIDNAPEVANQYDRMDVPPLRVHISGIDREKN
jgi:hypothetical protein